jgi:hypothetical protein
MPFCVSVLAKTSGCHSPIARRCNAARRRQYWIAIRALRSQCRGQGFDPPRLYNLGNRDRYVAGDRVELTIDNRFSEPVQDTLRDCLSLAVL